MWSYLELTALEIKYEIFVRGVKFLGKAHTWFGNHEANTWVRKDAVFTAILHSVFAMKKFYFHFPLCNADAVLAMLEDT